MPGKRRDQRILIDQGLAALVLSQAGVESEIQDLCARLATLVSEANERLEQADLEGLARHAGSTSGRRGEPRFEIDPDGKMVLVVSYGGESTPALTRDTFKAKAWNKQSAPKVAKAPPKPSPKRGFMKTSPSVTPMKVVQPSVPNDQFEDDLTRLFESDNAPTPEPAYTPAPQGPKKVRKLTRLSGSGSNLKKKGNPLEAAFGADGVDLAGILASDPED